MFLTGPFAFKAEYGQAQQDISTALVSLLKIDDGLTPWLISIIPQLKLHALSPDKALHFLDAPGFST